MIEWILIIVLVALDQISKYAVHTAMALGEAIPVIPGVFQLRHVHNDGAAFSILQGKQLFFTIIYMSNIILMFFNWTLYIERIWKRQV